MTSCPFYFLFQLVRPRSCPPLPLVCFYFSCSLVPGFLPPFQPYIEKIEEGKKRYALAYKAYEKDLKKWKKENDADESEEEEENGSDDASNISKGKKQIQSKKQRKKKVVDPNAPKKKTANPYLLFAKDNRAKIKEENPKWKNTGILKEIGRLWSSMSELEKAVCQTLPPSF